jgi:hypothetical protein
MGEKRGLPRGEVRSSPGVFENEMQRRIFGPKMGEVTRGCRKQHNAELHDFFSSRNNRVIKAGMKRAGYCSHMVEVRSACEVVVGKRGPIPSGIQRPEWVI